MYTYTQWRRSVVKSRGQGHSGQAIKLEADRNSFSFSAPKIGYLVIFGFFRFRPKMNFHCFIFRLFSIRLLSLCTHLQNFVLSLSFKLLAYASVLDCSSCAWQYLRASLNAARVCRILCSRKLCGRPAQTHST